MMCTLGRAQLRRRSLSPAHRPLPEPAQRQPRAVAAADRVAGGTPRAPHHKVHRPGSPHTYCKQLAAVAAVALVVGVWVAAARAVRCRRLWRISYRGEAVVAAVVVDGRRVAGIKVQGHQQAVDAVITIIGITLALL